MVESAHIAGEDRPMGGRRDRHTFGRTLAERTGANTDRTGKI